MCGGLILSLQDREGAGGFHPLKDINGTNALMRTIITLKLCNIYPIVVLARYSQDIWQTLPRLGVSYAGPENPDEDIAPYLEKAISLIGSETSKLLVTSTNFALVKPETINDLLNQERVPLRPCFNDEPGYPVLINLPRSTITLSSLYDTLVYVPCSYHTPDPGVTNNLETNEDWRSAWDAFTPPRVRPISKLTLAREQVFFGPGAYALLEAIIYTGSVRSACSLSGISYSKARKMIGLAETGFGFQILIRKKGGESGGRSIVTPEGLDLMERYRAFVSECNTTVTQSFKKHFSKYNKEQGNNDSGNHTICP